MSADERPFEDESLPGVIEWCTTFAGNYAGQINRIGVTLRVLRADRERLDALALLLVQHGGCKISRIKWEEGITLEIAPAYDAASDNEPPDDLCSGEPVATTDEALRLLLDAACSARSAVPQKDDPRV